MATIYTCESCHLMFKLGLFHYHSFKSGYGSATELICKKCGTPHLVEIALRDRGNEYYYSWEIFITRVPEESRMVLLKYIKSLFKMNFEQTKDLIDHLPLHIKGPLSEEEKTGILDNLDQMEVESEPNICAKHINSAYGPIQQDKLKSTTEPMFENFEKWQWKSIKITGKLKGVCGKFRIESQKCSYCHSRGNLISEWAGHTCPNCNQKSIIEMGVFSPEFKK